MSADVIRAAGGVIFRRRAGILETLIVHRPRYDDLTLPKGKAHDGESIEATALREIREETGVTGELGPELQSVRYTDPLGRPKTVRYWLVKADGVEDFQPDHEVDALAWVAVGEAPATLTNQRDREVLAEAAQQVGIEDVQLPLRSGTLTDLGSHRLVDLPRGLDAALREGAP